MDENITTLSGRLHNLQQEKEPNWEEVENTLIKIQLRLPSNPLHEYKERGVIVVNISKWPNMGWESRDHFLSKQELILEGLSPKTSWHHEAPNYDRIIFEVAEPSEADIFAISHYSLNKEVVIVFLRPDGTPSFYVVNLYSGKIEKPKKFVEGKTTPVPIRPDELAKREAVMQKFTTGHFFRVFSRHKDIILV